MINPDNIIRVFLSSPGNVVEERRRAENTIHRLNSRLAEELGVMIHLICWENIPPSAGIAQDIINRSTPDFDLFLGIMADRFGSPTEKFDSGTQEEFERAYAKWKKEPNTKEVMFYFKIADAIPNNPDDAYQLFQVLKFKSELSSKLIYREYSTPEEFDVFLREDLEKNIRNLVSKKIAFQENLSVPKKAENIRQVDIEEINKLWTKNKLSTSFIPGTDKSPHKFYRARIQTTGGWVKNREGIEEYKDNFVTLVKDPIRPIEIQIGETRALRMAGNPPAIPDLVNLDLASIRNMYPFFQAEGYKWVRMVLAELTTDPNVLDYIHQHDKDPDVRNIASKNPSASNELQKSECLFCSDQFRAKRNDIKSGSKNTKIITNDYPYGPYFHYIAFPDRSVHSWEELELNDVVDLNVTIWKYLNRVRDSGNWLPAPAGVFIGLNSSIKHLVMGPNTRTSAGASISHIHKQIWGMTPGSVNLATHLSSLCDENPGYLSSYIEFLRQEGMILWEDKYTVLYIPFGQISLHELQIFVHHSDAAIATNYLSLSREQVESLSIAETIAIRLLKSEALNIHSFNEIVLNLPFDSENENFHMIMCFITREVDIAVSELNHLFVVDKYPENTRDLLAPIKDKIIEEVLKEKQKSEYQFSI